MDCSKASGGAGHSSRSKATSSSSKKRKRVATVAQRRAANIRERRRMFNLNEAFDKLRRKVPTFAYEKRLSRIETLRLAITYISFMDQVVRGAETKAPSPAGAHQSLIGQQHQQHQQHYLPIVVGGSADQQPMDYGRQVDHHSHW